MEGFVSSDTKGLDGIADPSSQSEPEYIVSSSSDSDLQINFKPLMDPHLIAPFELTFEPLMDSLLHPKLHPILPPALESTSSTHTELPLASTALLSSAIESKSSSKLISGSSTEMKFDVAEPAVEPELLLPHIKMEYYDWTSASSNSDSESESVHFDESQFQSYEFKHEGSSDPEMDPDFVLTREMIANDTARAAMKTLLKIEAKRGEKDFLRPKGSFPRCPQGGSPPRNYFRRNHPGPFLYCPVSHMHNDTFMKLPYPTKPKYDIDTWRRPTEMILHKKRWYTDCNKCETFYPDVNANPDQFYQDYVNQVTYKNRNPLGKNWRDYLKEQTTKLEKYGYIFPTYRKLKRLNKENKPRSADGKLVKKDFGRMGNRQSRVAGNKLAEEELKLSNKKEVLNYAKVKPLVPKHILRKRNPPTARGPTATSKLQVRPVSTPIRPRYKPQSQQRDASLERSPSPTKETDGKKGRMKNPISVVKLSRTKQKAVKAVEDEQSYDESQDQQESEGSYEDPNANFRKPNGEFDDDKYRKCVIDMLTKDLREVATAKPKNTKKKALKSGLKKKPQKGQYANVKSRVDTKPPSCMRVSKVKSSKSNGKAKVVNKKKGRKSGGLFSAFDSADKKKLMTDMANELRKEMESTYLSVPDDLRI